MSPRTVTLHEIANARSGDKGNRLNIALVCREPAHYPAVARQITAERVAEAFAARKPSRVTRYDLPGLGAFNFVLDDVLEGGVNASLGLDGHGKSLSFLLLETWVINAVEQDFLYAVKSDLLCQTNTVTAALQTVVCDCLAADSPRGATSLSLKLPL